VACTGLYPTPQRRSQKTGAKRRPRIRVPDQPNPNNAANQDAPIGVFDSGLGGLTVVRAIQERLPGENLVYLGDLARLPYGTRSAQTVQHYARACARRLSEHGIKFLVVACNTVSAVALEILRAELTLPVLGVIEPGARAGVAASRSGRIGVIATAGTVQSGAYPRAAAATSRNSELFMEPAPLLVPLVEEGWLEGEVPELVVRRYLRPLVEQKIDALVLGCTHYPLLQQVITRELAALSGEELPVVDSAHATAEELAELLRERGLSRPGSSGSLRMFVTDMPGRFSEAASRFLGRGLDGLDISAIDL
jgi:glutamate racemase